MRLSWAWIILLCLAELAFEYRLEKKKKKKLIIDTDLFSDVDDTAALLLACTHPEVDLLGVNVNYPSTYSGLAASSILGYYGFSHLPIGLTRPFTNATFFDHYAYQHGEYASKLAYHWREYAALSWIDVSSTSDPVDLYRRLLSHEEDRTVTIASIGFLDNLSGLLSSAPDLYSSLPGRELVEEKVSELVIMGGQYPSGQEFNFAGHNATAAAHVVNAWPGRITFSGFEMGQDVYSGADLMVNGPENDPINAAYRWYNGYNIPRESWDPLTVLYAINGLGDIFAFGNEGGHNYVYPNGTNVWQPEDKLEGSHSYLKLKVGTSVAGALLDKLFLHGALNVAKCSCQEGPLKSPIS
ncbi:inosine-uridine preferring nucleoside hydrolase-domain-containing protein [Aspergillus stella-maris]|uniref:inosine-uridine preferring nucleoside hydrolase-domain-containing protein n=1 Tax=Aspergillus stella-maris TaxID=1810926 RepID=UPI003CCD9D2D